jgi:hypothetical protein
MKKQIQAILKLFGQYAFAALLPIAFALQAHLFWQLMRELILGVR